jgi:excisionase family DNA binding protein
MIRKKHKIEWKQLSLAKAAETLGYKESYLLRLASSGKLKAYKFGEEWLTTKEWLDEWKETVKKKVVEENAKISHHDKWVKHLPERKRKDYHFDRRIDFSLASITLASACLLAFGLIMAVGQPQKPISVASKILDQKPVVAEKFLTLTNRAYYFPIIVIDKVSVASLKVLDFSTSYVFFATADMEDSIISDAKLAILAWNDLEAKKIPDENLTGFLRQTLASIGLGSWSEKNLPILGINPGNGRVAGDSAVWPQ